MATSGGRARPRYRWAVKAYDSLYRLLHGLDSPASAVGPVLRVEIRRIWRPRTLPDGTRLAPGDRIGILHLDNAHVAALHVDGRSPLALGLEFRRRLMDSLHVLAAQAAPGGPLAGVRAFAAVTIFHRGLSRLGFVSEPDSAPWARLVAAYQRALLASLHPAGHLRFHRAAYPRACRLWLTRDVLVARYGRAPLAAR